MIPQQKAWEFRLPCGLRAQSLKSLHNEKGSREPSLGCCLGCCCLGCHSTMHAPLLSGRCSLTVRVPLQPHASTPALPSRATCQVRSLWMAQHSPTRPLVSLGFSGLLGLRWLKWSLLVGLVRASACVGLVSCTQSEESRQHPGTQNRRRQEESLQIGPNGFFHRHEDSIPISKGYHRCDMGLCGHSQCRGCGVSATENLNPTLGNLSSTVPAANSVP